MGSSSSKNNEWAIAEEKRAKEQAIRNYNYRIKNYNPIIHGDRYIYMYQVEAEYELECIPKYLRHGSGYSSWD